MAQKLLLVPPSKSLQVNSFLNISITTKSPKIYDRSKCPKQKAPKFYPQKIQIPKLTNNLKLINNPRNKISNTQNKISISEEKEEGEYPNTQFFFFSFHRNKIAEEEEEGEGEEDEDEE